MVSSKTIKIQVKRRTTFILQQDFFNSTALKQSQSQFKLRSVSLLIFYADKNNIIQINWRLIQTAGCHDVINSDY